jgi:hypothetical protein
MRDGLTHLPSDLNLISLTRTADIVRPPQWTPNLSAKADNEERICSASGGKADNPQRSMIYKLMESSYELCHLSIYWKDTVENSMMAVKLFQKSQNIH